jgi:protein-L-isoaspartate O-methyltransferase
VAHRGLPFANPMSEAAVDRVLDALRLPPGALVLDTGCGSGAMLLRALARDPTSARYEETLASSAERARDPESLAYARRIRDRRALADGTTTLGFALLLLRARD